LLAWLGIGISTACWSTIDRRLRSWRSS